MPIMDGYESIVEIKKIRPNIPIIAQTALAFQEDQVKAKIAGFDDYLIKPFRLDALLEKISKYL